MTSRGSSVVTVTRPSPASRAGLRKGDIIVSCNGQPVRDWVDLLAQSSSTGVDLLVRRGVSERHFRIRRVPGRELGLKLADSGPRQCGNRCLFCFVDQQPPGLRESLLVKDDDVRYSFLQGTYITLTDRQTREAIERGFNTLHVSVHTTDAELRGKLLGRPGPMPVLKNIALLGARGIEVEAQVVAVPGFNDGDALERTIADLYSVPSVRILGVVPVGLTAHRQDLPRLRRPSPGEAAETIEKIRAWQSRALRERGVPWVFAADEYYLLSNGEIPETSHYDTCTLQANGIGLLSGERERCTGRNFTGEGTVITGELAFPFLDDILAGTGYRVIPVENRLMGREVGVAGLLGGKDIIRSIRDYSLKSPRLYLPSVMFNHRNVTLDGLSSLDIARETELETSVLGTIGELP